MRIRCKGRSSFRVSFRTSRLPPSAAAALSTACRSFRNGMPHRTRTADRAADRNASRLAIGLVVAPFFRVSLAARSTLTAVLAGRGKSLTSLFGVAGRGLSSFNVSLAARSTLITVLAGHGKSLLGVAGWGLSSFKSVPVLAPTARLVSNSSTGMLLFFEGLTTGVVEVVVDKGSSSDTYRQERTTY
jgi:hypothetical protein